MKIRCRYSSEPGSTIAPRHRELLPVQSARLLLPEPGSPQKKPPAEPPHHTLKDSASQVQAINRELESLIGLAKVKQLIKEIEAFIVIQSWRQEERLAADPLVLHMIFKGNPGSGKTTIARLIARLFKEMGVLQRGHLVEVERADLVGEYIGHTAQKTREQIRRAQGGVLFIDEAYSLIRGGERDFGKECIDTLVRSMEEMKNEFVLILAGYSKEMDRFISSNPGLRSRFPIIIDFPDYSIEELMKIADLMLDARQYCLSGDARKELINCLLNQTQDGNDYHGNARLVRNLIEKGIRRQAVRLMGLSSISREDLVLIRQQDIRGGID